jgi:hypothetical protein
MKVAGPFRTDIIAYTKTTEIVYWYSFNELFTKIIMPIE